MRRVKLKNNKKKYNKFILLIIAIIATLIIIFNYIGNVLTPILIDYAEKQAKKISVLVISSAVDNKLSENFNSDKLFISKNNEVDYNTYEINNILREIGTNVKEYLIKLESGELGDIGLSDSDSINIDYGEVKNGVIYQIPTGIIFNNGLLANLGPKIPVKLSLIGNVTTDLVIDVKEYGINNAVIKLGVKVTAEEQVILPFNTKQISVDTVIPISIKIISGNVPNYYPYTLSTK